MLKQVTSLGSSAATILTISPFCKYAYIQNNGSNNVRISFDGGTGHTDITGATGTEPTASLGFKLVAGQSLNFTPELGDKRLRVIRAIMETGSTTLDIGTDDNRST